MLVSFINYFKIAIRGDPLIAEDLLLIGEGAGTMGDYELHFPALFFVSFGLVLVGALALMRYARARIPKKRLWVRALGVLACVALGLLSWRLWYGDKALYDAQRRRRRVQLRARVGEAPRDGLCSGRFCTRSGRPCP